MDINPQRVRTAEFATARKGLDPEEVREFLAQVADELERAQNQATAMEARARAAVARLQQMTDDGDASGPVAAPAAAPAEAAAPTQVVPVVATAAPAPEQIAASVDESETISRTMLLAQRAADMTIAEAEAEAARLRSEADAAAAALVEQAKAEARAAGDSEREVVASEVNALIARRDFLESDVDHMEQFLVDQRTRLREAATSMIDIAERVPGGLGEVRRPLLSASDDEPQDATMPYLRPADETDDDAVGSTDALDDDTDALDDDTDALDDDTDALDDDTDDAVAADAVGDAAAGEPASVMRLGFDES